MAKSHFEIEYTTLNTLNVWAENQAEAEIYAQTQPNFVGILSTTNEGAYPYVPLQEVYWFNDDTDAVLKGVISSINFVSFDLVKVFVSFTGIANPLLFENPHLEENQYVLFLSEADAFNYLGRNLPVPPPASIPSVPSILSASQRTTTSFKLNWLGVSGALYYNVYVNDAKIFGNAVDTEVVIPSLSPGVTYEVEVTALNSLGESAKSDALLVTTLPNVPTQPTGLVASNIVSDEFQLDWIASVGADSYNVYLNGVLEESGVTGLTVTLSGLSSSTLYTVVVRGVNDGGESIASPSIDVTTLPAVPPIPVNLSFSNPTTSQVDLDWDDSFAATGYNIYQDNVIIQASHPVSDYILTGLSPGTSYDIEVSAENVAGESDRSDILEILTIPAPPDNLAASNIGDDSLDIEWDVSTGATSYDLYIDDLLAYSNILTNSQTVLGLPSTGTSYKFEVLAKNSSGSSDLSDPLNVLTLPGPPTGLSFLNVDSNSFDLTWDPEPGATTYNVYRDTVLIQSGVVGTLLDITGLAPSTEYSMQVSGVNVSGEGLKSAPIDVTTTI